MIKNLISGLFLFFLFCSTAFGTWDRVPTNINNTTYFQNLHAVRGHDALVRVGNTVMALTPYHSTQEALWRSTDNGDTWSIWWSGLTSKSSTLIRGKNDQIYFFYRYTSSMYMMKFHIGDASPPSPVTIASSGASNYGAYYTTTSTVDSEGRLFVFWSEPDDTISTSDKISMVISDDEGATWGTKQTVISPDADDGWYNAQAAVSLDNQLYVVTSSFQDDPREVRVLISNDHGATWASNTLLYSGVMTNPHVVTKGYNDVWVFTQCEDNDSPSPGRGLQGIHSTDSGASWSAWQLIDRSCNYADPTAAITSTGGIVISYRNDNELGEIGTLCGESSYQTIITSDDDGVTWTVRQWLNTLEQAGTQSRLRYQTWYTGGGVLEWSWMNYSDGGTTTPIFYSQNSDVTIMTTDASSSGIKVIDYGYEDWTGDANTTPGYIYSTDDNGTNDDGYWRNHRDVTEVVSNCEGRAAHSGTYYWHQQISANYTDPCTGYPGSVQGDNNIGWAGLYPLNSGDDTKFDTDIKSDTQTVRFYFRTTGTWKTQVAEGGGNMGYFKFIRVFGAGTANTHLHLRIRDEATTTFYLIDESNESYDTMYDAGIDLTDGDWHSVCFKVVRNNDTNDTGNITKTVWFDDWDMAGAGTSVTVTVPGFGANYEYTKVIGNWSASYPTTNMGIDVDDLEIWDGTPSSSSDPSPFSGIVTSRIISIGCNRR